MMRRCIEPAPLSIIEDCDISYSGKYFKREEIEFPKFFVYAWRREEYLYIGQSSREQRVRNHNIIKLKETDYIDIWICVDRSVALKLEEELIRYYKPQFNKMYNSNIKIVKKEIFIPSNELMSCKNPKEFKELRKKYKDGRVQ